MKTLYKGIICVAMATVSVTAMAQSNDSHPLTRAEVRQQLIDVEKAGYKPTASEANYPADIQAAEQRVEQSQQMASNDAGASGEQAGYGASTDGTSSTGGIDTRALPPTFFGQ